MSRFLPKRLKRAREEAGIEIDALLKRVDIVRLTLANWESGRTRPDAVELGKYAALCGKDLSFFYSRCAVQRPTDDKQKVGANV